MPRSGRLVVAVVLVLGLGLGALGAWWVVHARPRPGAFVDVLALPHGGAIVIRRERGTDHGFVEVRDPDRLRWRGLIPRYAGTPGTIAVAATDAVVTVRVSRGGHPHLFAFDTRNGAKIASFDLADDVPPDPAAYTLPGLATVGEGDRAVEVLARPGGGARLILVELRARRLAWRVDVPAPPDEVWITGDQVVARRGDALTAWAVATGAPVPPASAEPPGNQQGGGVHFRDDGYGTGGSGQLQYMLPPTAVRARRHHQGGGRIWIVEPDRLTVLDGTLAPVQTVRAAD